MANGVYNIDLDFTNENQTKNISTTGTLHNGRLTFDLEHTCGNILSTDQKINFDMGTFPVSISESENLLYNTFIKIQ
jgi:hypothetical protein